MNELSWDLVEYTPEQYAEDIYNALDSMIKRIESLISEIPYQPQYQTFMSVEHFLLTAVNYPYSLNPIPTRDEILQHEWTLHKDYGWFNPLPLRLRKFKVLENLNKLQG